MRSIVSDGLGGCLSALSFVDLYHKKCGINPFQNIYFICDKKIYEALTPFLDCRNHCQSELSDIELAKQLQDQFPNEKIVILTPDHFGTVPNYEIYFTGIRWEEVLNNQFLQYHYYRPKENNVLLALNTAQENNSYPYESALIVDLCDRLPDHTFWFANLKEWSGKKLELAFNPEELAAQIKNFKVYNPISLSNDLIWIGRNIKYFIGTDNGIINYAYYLGRQYILLDSRYANPQFCIRWRHEGFRKSLPFTIPPVVVSRTFELLVKNPELSALDVIDVARAAVDTRYLNVGYKQKPGFY